MGRDDAVAGRHTAEMPWSLQANAHSPMDEAKTMNARLRDMVPAS